MVYALRFRWIRHSRVCILFSLSSHNHTHTHTLCILPTAMCLCSFLVPVSCCRSCSHFIICRIYIYIGRYRCIHFCTQAAFTALVYDNHNIYVYYIGRFSVECVNICLFSSTEIFCIATARWKVNETRCVCKSTRIAYTIRDNQPNSYAVFAKSKTINTKQFFLLLACFGCIVSWLFIFLRYFRFGSESLYWSVDRSVLFGNFMQFRYFFYSLHSVSICLS